MDSYWLVTQEDFDPGKQHHMETVFTIGNGYLCSRGAFEEGYPNDSRATFIHGVFDQTPIVFTELANAPDWLPLTILLNGERFSLDEGELESFERTLDLRTGVLTRTIRWRSHSGYTAQFQFQRFASLADPHTLYLRCQVTPEFDGIIQFRSALNGNTDNQGLAHWEWLDQGMQDETVFLHNRTRTSHIQMGSAMRFVAVAGQEMSRSFWDVENRPTTAVEMLAIAGQAVVMDKFVSVYTTRDVPEPVQAAVERVNQVVDWPSALKANALAWEQEWQRTDVVIEGDDEAQIAVRFNLFQMLIAAPRHDDRVNIGAKTLSGFGYRGHAFWDTEVFMLPLFIYTAPHIARNLLNYRYRNLPGARRKAAENGFEGAQFPWESADTGDEVTPTWVPHYADRTQLVRIWTGDIEIHISADIAYAAQQYWKLTGDDAWMVEFGAELILDTAKFWASRAEWNASLERYEYNEVIGPDEYHEHVNNNAFTNRMAQWNLQLAVEMLDWLHTKAPDKAAQLVSLLDLTPERLAKWQDVIAKVYLPGGPGGVIEQFEGYFKRTDVDLAAMEPRTQSVQTIFGIQGANDTQVLKQPDVLMLQYLLADDYSDAVVKANYAYYTPRTDHTFGSSLGPSIQAIMACRVGLPDDAYEHFIRAVRADLRDVRGNAGDGIHGASAGGTWQSVVFGFGGLRVHQDGWELQPRLPSHWKRLAFKFFYKGQLQTIDIHPEAANGD
jgi:trehalose/maltose hydrolase-like predicted phosphorylase